MSRGSWEDGAYGPRLVRLAAEGLWERRGLVRILR